MNHLTHLAWMHKAAGLHLAYYHHGGGNGSWIGQMVVSAVVHALIYGAIFRLLRHLSLGEIVVLTIVVIGGLYYWNRNRSNRGW